MKKSTTKRKYFAFTLAEVLITLTIIGIVAAVVIPVVNNAVTDIQLKTAWKKDYSILMQAYLQLKQDEGGVLDSYFSGIQTATPLLSEFGNYLKVIKNCNYTTDNIICGTTNVTLNNNDIYKTLSNGGYVNYNNLAYKQYVLADGANFYARSYNIGYALIFIDVNGYAKGPNTLGKDLFGVTFTKDKMMPMGAVGTGLQNTCNSTAVTCPAGQGFEPSNGDCAGAGCSAEYLQ